MWLMTPEAISQKKKNIGKKTNEKIDDFRPDMQQPLLASISLVSVLFTGLDHMVLHQRPIGRNAVNAQLVWFAHWDSMR